MTVTAPFERSWSEDGFPEQKRARLGSWPSSETADMDAGSDTASSCSSFLCPSEAGSPAASPKALRRTGSEPDLLVLDSDLEAQVRSWREDLGAVTAQPEEVLEELLVAHVREHGWDTAERLSEMLLEADSSRAFATAKVPQEPREPKSAVCLVCLEEVSDSPLLEVSRACGHRLHRCCLADGLRVQMRNGADSLRCPACPECSSAPLSEELLRSVLPEVEDFDLRQRRRWRRAGEESLFRTCPSGCCQMRHGKENPSLQLVCGCEGHRFCSSCGEAPHEPVPCHMMMEVKSSLSAARAQLSVERQQRINALTGSSRDRQLLMEDLQESQEVALLPEQNWTGSEAQLQKDFEQLLGSKTGGCLRRSAETAMVLLRGWQLQQDPQRAARPEESAPPASEKSGEDLLETFTRPCPRCFVPIAKDGGCQHMTCSNSRCGHEFCWLCLRDWKNPEHNALRCALQRLDSMSAEREGLGGVVSPNKDEIMAEVEERIRENFQATPAETRPASEEAYAEEVRRRFGVALSTGLPSDAELLSGAMGVEEEPLLLSFWILRLYSQREWEAREAAAVAFCESTDPTSAGQARRQLAASLAWLRQRWWLRLRPDDAAGADVEEAIDMATGGELEIRAQLRVARLRAEFAVRCLERREAKEERERLEESLAHAFVKRFGTGSVLSPKVRTTLLGLLQEDQSSRIWEEMSSASSSTSGPHATAVASARRALALAVAADRAWRTGDLLEEIGRLPRNGGLAAQRAASSAVKWLEEMEERSGALSELLAAGLQTPTLQEESSWQLQVTQASGLVDGARRLVFKFALEYCGGSRRMVQRRGQQ